MWRLIGGASLAVKRRLRAFVEIPPLGRRGEDCAARYLRRKGLRIVARSVRLPQGEIDLVALDGQTVVFVEVKTRRDHRAGRPEDAVDDRKQQKLIRLAKAFLTRHDLFGHACRFDVVAITWPSRPGTRVSDKISRIFGHPRPNIRHFERAFQSAS